MYWMRPPSAQSSLMQRIWGSQDDLSTMERGEMQIGSEILLRMRREFGKSTEAYRSRLGAKLPRTAKEVLGWPRQDPNLAET